MEGGREGRRAFQWMEWLGSLDQREVFVGHTHMESCLAIPYQIRTRISPVVVELMPKKLK